MEEQVANQSLWNVLSHAYTYMILTQVLMTFFP